MKKRTTKNVSAKSSAGPKDPPPPQPVNVVDGVPDAAVSDKKSSRWRLGLVLLIFAAWAAFLIYCLLAARV